MTVVKLTPSNEAIFSQGLPATRADCMGVWTQLNVLTTLRCHKLRFMYSQRLNCSWGVGAGPLGLFLYIPRWLPVDLP